MNSKKIKILYIDDELLNLSAFKASFRREYEVFTAKSTKVAREVLEKEEVHIIISDEKMPEETGVQFFKKILTEYPKPIRILLTGYSEKHIIDDALENGKVFKCLYKPWNEDLIKDTIQKAFDLWSSQNV